MKLSEAPTGTRYTIIGYNTKDKEFRQKLFRMGLVKGVEFEIGCKAPLGDPIKIHLSGSYIMIRAKELDTLEVKDYEL